MNYNFHETRASGGHNQGLKRKPAISLEELAAHQHVDDEVDRRVAGKEQQLQGADEVEEVGVAATQAAKVWHDGVDDECDTTGQITGDVHRCHCHQHTGCTTLFINS